MNEQQFNAIPKTQRFNQVLEGTAFYASVQTPNTTGQAKFGGPVYYGVHLGLDDVEVMKAEAMGLKILPATDKIPFKHVKIIRKLTKKEIEKAMKITEVKPQVVDSKQKEVPNDLLIGNGSKVLCKFGTYWYPNQGGGVGTMLSKVQIRELVPYTRGSDPTLVMDDEGFSIEGENEAGPSTQAEAGTASATFAADPLPWDEPTPQAVTQQATKKLDKAVFDN